MALQELSGFGPVAAAARTAQLLAVLRPRRVLLLGIAGAYDIERHPIGSALEFSEVALDGVGVGEGRGFRGPPAIGFPQWPGRPVRGQPDDGGDEDLVGAVHDRLLLGAGGGEGLLLTTCAASASPAEAAVRLERFPEALAEDMEGFAVALACALEGVPLCIVRGISNQVGVRDPAHWRIPAALAAARRAALERLVAEDWGTTDGEARR